MDLIQLVIFEGCDGTGKTSLATRLANKIGADYVHCGPYKGLSRSELIAEYFNIISPVLAGSHSVVMDRSWISEVIYGIVLRGGLNRVAGNGFKALQKASKTVRATYILCDAEYELVKSTYSARKAAELAPNYSALHNIWAKYHHISLGKRVTREGSAFADFNILVDRCLTGFSATMPSLWRTLPDDENAKYVYHMLEKVIGESNAERS